MMPHAVLFVTAPDFEDQGEGTTPENQVPHA
jgi:hypothetical protein